MLVNLLNGVDPLVLDNMKPHHLYSIFLPINMVDSLIHLPKSTLPNLADVLEFLLEAPRIEDVVQRRLLRDGRKVSLKNWCVVIF